MSLEIGLDPQATSLLTALGITDDDGQLVAGWFDDPLGAIRRVLANPTQRAALFRLLDDVLPPGSAPEGWHPLLDTEVGNLYVTVEDDVVGVAATLHAEDLIPDVVGSVRGSVRVPLVSVAGDLEAIAGTAAGPVLVGVDVGFAGDSPVTTGVGAAVSVHLDDTAPLGVQAGVRITVDGFDLGGGDPVDLVVDSGHLGADLTRALRLLLREVVDRLAAEAGDGSQLARLAEHLFALVGIGEDTPGATAVIPPLPLEQLAARPEAVLDWLVDIVDSSDTLAAWATHLAGLLGDDLPVSGEGTAAEPLRAGLVDSDVVDLDLLVGVTEARELEIGLDLGVDAGPVALSAAVTVLRVPLPPLPGQPADPAAATRFTRVVPQATVALVTPDTSLLVDNAPDLQVGRVLAGFRLVDGQVQPWVAVTQVIVDDEEHGTVDLTDADAVIGVVADAALGVLEDAFGDVPAAEALLTLLGLHRPVADPTWPLLDPAALGRGPTQALGALHRSLLTDTAHPWARMLDQVALLVGLTPDVSGSGSPDDPWLSPIATAGPVSVSLAAWNARADVDPDGLQRLRLGLSVGATQGVFEGGLMVEVLAVDLPSSGPGSVAVIGRSELSVEITPDGPLDLSGLRLTSGPATGRAGWRPGEPPTWRVGIGDVTVTLGAETFGPFDWFLPGLQPDLGLGADALRVLGQLVSSALRSWAGEPAYVVAAALGLHRDLPELPEDWPLLGDVVGGADQLDRLLADPGTALRAHLGRVLTGLSEDATDFARPLLRLLGRLLPSAPQPVGSEREVVPFDLTGVRAVSGAGRYEDPWVVPVVAATSDPSRGATRVELLAWLDPAGPPPEWVATLAALADGVDTGVLLGALLTRAAALRPELALLLAGRGPVALGEGLDDLVSWLADGDGLVPLASQLPEGWSHGTTVTTPHALLPRDPQVISQVVAHLGGGSGPVLLVAPPFADHRIFDDLVAALTGAAPVPGHHLDLRALPDPTEVDLTQVTAVAGVYTADLLTDHAVSEVDQLESVVRRLRTLTGSPVRVVGHSTSGVVARTLAAAHPELVAGLVTLGSPHAGSGLGPLADPAMAEAVRVAAAVAGPVADTGLGATVGWLAGLLDGTGGVLGGAVRRDWFAGVAPGLVDPVPGLAVGSQLTGDLLGLLAGATVAGVSEGGAAPTHLGVGVRLGLATPQPNAGDAAALTADARVDLARVRFADGASEPTRPAAAVAVETSLVRPDGWLVGEGLLPDGPVGARVRRVESGLRVTPGLLVQPWLRLVDAAVSGPALPAVGLGHPDLRATFDAVLAALAAEAAANPAAAAGLDLLRAAGAVVDTEVGPRGSIVGLGDLATVPIRMLTERRAALVTALRDLLGDLDDGGLDPGGLDPTALGATLPELPLRLALDDVGGFVRLEAVEDVVLAGPLRIGGRLDLDTRTLAATADVAVSAGPAELRRDAAGIITAAAEPWVAPVTLRPFDPEVVRGRLLDAIPDLAVSGVASAVLGGLLGTGVTVPPISALVRDPVAWLRRPTALGDDAGRLDGDRINDLLRRVAEALELESGQGLELPGGFVLRTSGSDPLRVELDGTLGEAADPVRASVVLAVDLRPTGPAADGASGVRATPAGGVTLDLDLPDGDWGDLSVAFDVDADGVRLVVTPENVDPIQLLPTVSGLGDLLGSTVTALVPRVLQALTDELQTRPSHPVLDVALQVAEALGLYDPATGWTGTAQSQRLRELLDPGWLQTQVTDPALVIDHIRSLFPTSTPPTPGVIPLPLGHRVVRVEDRLRWEMDLLPGCVLGAEVGWAAAGHPQARVTLTGLDTGPVTVAEARLGFLDELEGLVRARVEVGDPLDWFTPELELSLAGDRLGVRVLPLGEDAASDVELVLLPSPDLTLTTEGGVRLVGSWMVPVVTRFVVPEVEPLLAEPLWPGGPSARKLLHGARLVTSDTGPLVVESVFPEPPALAMGALRTALSGLAVDVTDDLTLSFREDAGRLGIRLRGQVAIPGDDVSVTVHFGSHPWIGDAGGITAWVVGPSDDPAALPVAPAPGLDIIGAGLQIAGADEAHPLVGADPDSTVQLGGVAALLFARFDFWDEATGTPTFVVDGLGAGVELGDAAIRVDGGDGDSFVSKVVPEELRAGFTTAIAYRDGALEVHGGPGDLDNGIELTFPLNLDILGVVLLRELYLAGVFGDRTDVIAALSGNAELGPLAVTVDRVGLRVGITGSGAVLSFKPPDGFGLSLDASTVRLGGFLLVDEARGRYVGALEIAVLEKFALTAVGIVTTKHPDGTPGFSLLMLVTVTLPVPIPLGYGFFFSGAGGLLGLNRGMDVDRIRTGLRTGTADSILFPTDIIRRIDVIVRDLEESFPQQDGHFLIAPMAMIQWMNPALVTLKVGIILEIAPQPNIALLGVLRLALPTTEEAVVDLKVAFLGGIDVSASLLYFDAAIYDSFIGYADFKLSLEGDIAIRLCWGPRPDLVVTIGGFHPGYTPDAALKLPQMRRLTLSLLKDNPRITLRLYFAVTSNTIQFGAQLELFVGVAGFSISGELGFDVLVQFVPFLIDAHMWGRLAVTAGGVDVCSISLDLSLRGPTPWLAHGRASFTILFFKVTVEVEATFGDAHEATLTAEPVLSRVLDAFRDPLNWAAELDAAASAGVVLLPLPSGTLVVDAGGLLSARQNLIPLATDLGLVGKTPPSDVRRVTITDFTVGTDPAAPADGTDPAYVDLTAPFAPSTFAGASATGADLLTAPAFENRPHGVRATSGTSLQADVTLPHPQHYEMIVIDDPDPEAPTPPAVAATPALSFSQLVAGGTVAASAAAAAQRRRAERGSVRAAVAGQPRYAITTTDALVPLDAQGRPATTATALLSRTEAEQRLADLATDGRRLQIVPEVHVG